jgi:hypothetical protein
MIADGAEIATGATGVVADLDRPTVAAGGRSGSGGLNQRQLGVPERANGELPRR